jgi:choice-of-anchor C domain-containing protein
MNLIRLISAVLAAFTAVPALAAPFTPGNVVIYRVGNGGDPLASTGAQVFLDEFNPSGTLVQSLPMPTTATGANRRLVASGTATAEGLLTRSADGRFLILTGYDATIPYASALPGTAASTVYRTVGRVGHEGSIDTSTFLQDFADGGAPRAAATSDGSKFWLAGSTGGVRFAPFGATTTSTRLNDVLSNMRQPLIFDSQLYVSTAQTTGGIRIGTVGIGLPTTAGQTITNLPGVPTTGSPYAFQLLDLTPSVPGPDTLYLADEGIGLRKFSLVAGVWSDNGSIGTDSDDYRGLTASVSGTGVTLFATRLGGSTAPGGGELVILTDTSGYNGTITGTPTLLATAAANTAFRGVALTPYFLPDLTIEVTAPPTAVPGEQFSYLVTARNIGSAAADQLRLRFTVPDGLTILPPGIPTQFIGQFNGRTFECTGNTFPFEPGAEVTFEILVSGTPGTYTVAPESAVVDPNHLVAEVNETNNQLGSPVVTVIPAPPSAPTITSIVPYSISENSSTGAIPFSIGDADSELDSLVLTKSSSNTTLVPNANIVFGGSGANRTVTVTPAANQIGTATITIEVSDGSLSASESFVLTVNKPATITTHPANQTIPSGTTATLTVAASGSEPLTYQWYQGISGDMTTPVGTNSASFTTPPITSNTSYWVKVSNSEGSVNSSTANVIVALVAAPNRIADTVTFNRAGTSSWTCPAGVTSIQVECWGGGGAGGSGTKAVDTATNTSQNGGGGGGGAYARRVAVPVTPGQTYTITIPPAAVSVPASDATSVVAVNGESVTFVGDAGVTVSATGGRGGRSAWTNLNQTVGRVGGAGGSAIAGDAGSTFSGGAGAAGTTGTGNQSGGGGGSAGDASNGGNADGKIAGSGGIAGGGAGGDGRGDGNTNPGAGAPGTTPGGGGGGAKNQGLGTQPGGTGGLGQITITHAPLTIGNPGNPSDPTTGRGSVAYTYKIGRYEVTNSQYTEFLNAVDPTGVNPNGIYNTLMGSDPRGGISFNSGAANGTKYTVRTSMDDKPVNYVSWYDAARYTNWLHNGQGIGNTETGAYTLTGNTGVPTRNAGATVWIPSEDEWYKAAYYDPTPGAGGGDNYWTYPTRSDSVPTVAAADSFGNVSNPGANVANYNSGADWNSQNGNLTTVGSAAANNYYGTFDQGGNVHELTDALYSNGNRGLRGSSMILLESQMRASTTLTAPPDAHFVGVGFRVASLDQPDALILNFGLPGQPAEINHIEGTITWNVPAGTNFASLAPTYTVAPLASEDPAHPSDSTRDFTTPQTYTITSQNGGTRVYIVNVGAADITTHPGSQTITIGGTANLSVTATGTEPLTYQWYQGFSGDTTTPVGTNSPNFTTPVLTVTTSYWVKVTNPANPTGANSNTATVTIATAEAHMTRLWTGVTGGAWLTPTNWDPTGTFPGEAPNAVVTGEGAATDVMGVASANGSANIGINMDTLTAGAGGLGLSLGGIDFSAGINLQVGNSSSSGNGILQLNGATLYSVPKTLVRIAGNANLTIANVNTGSGSQTMGLRLGITDGIFVVGAGRTLTISSAVSEAVPHSGFTKTGSGTLNFTGAVDYSGATLVSAGKLAIPSSHSGTGPATISANAALGVTASGTSQWQPASLALADPCTLEFSNLQNPGTTIAPLQPAAAVGPVLGVTVNINSFSGTVLINNRYPLLGNQGGTTAGYTLGTQPPGFTGHLDFSGNTLVYVVDTAPDVWTGANLSNPSFWDIGTTPNWTGNAAGNSPAGSYTDGDVVLFNDSATPASPVTVVLQTPVAPGNILFANNTKSYSISSSGAFGIGGSGTLTKSGGGLLTLGGANSYSGVTTVDGGSLSITHSSALGSTAGATTINGGNGSGGVTLSLSSATSALTIAEPLNFFSNPSGRARLTNSSALNHELTGPVDVSSSVSIVQFDSGGTGSLTVSGDITGTMSNEAVFILRGGSTSALNRVLGNLTLSNGNLIKTDNGTWLVGAPGKNYAWNDTTVAVGILKLGVANIVDSSGMLNLGNSTGTSSGTLDLNGFSQEYSNIGYSGAGGSSTGTRTVTSTSGSPVLTINNPVDNSPTNGTAANSVVLSGSLALTKQGAGKLTFSGANTNTGAYTVAGGTLQFARQASLYNNQTGNWTAAKLNVKSGGTLAFNVGGTGEFTPANVTTLLANLAASSSPTQGMNGGSNIGFDTTNASGGTFTIADGIADTTGASGGARGLTKTGAGILNLNGANTYTGDTTITAGTLAIGSSSSLPAATDLVMTGGKLDLNGQNATVQSLAVNGTDIIIDFGTASSPNTLEITAGAVAGWTGNLLIHHFNPTTDQLFFGTDLSGINGNATRVSFVDPVGLAPGSYALLTGPDGASLPTSTSGGLPPVITAQPASQTIASSSSATLTVTATGSGPLGYQWYQGISGDTTTPVGTNSASFTTPALLSTTPYWVQVSNGFGAPGNSNTATVTVTAPQLPDLIVSLSAPATATVGQNFDYTITVRNVGNTPASTDVSFLLPSRLQFTGSTAPPGFTGGHLGGGVGNFTGNFGAGSTSIFTISVQSPNPGTITTAFDAAYVNASASVTEINETNNGSGMPMTTIIGSPPSPPTITTHPTSQTITSGSTATLSVTATGTEPLTYQWYQGISGDTTTPVGTNSASFTTPALTATTSYWVRVSNSAGSTDSDAATIRINLLTNGGFESPAIGGSLLSVFAPNSTTLTGWTVSAGDIEIIRPGIWSPSEGLQSLDMSGVSAATIYQDVPGFTPGATYRITFDLSGNPVKPSELIKQLRVTAAGQSNDFDFDVTSTDSATMGWVGREVVFVATAATERIQFVSLTPGDRGPALDNVALVFVAPPTDTPPTITTQPASQTIPSATTATLTVTASGSEPLSYQWYLGNSGDTTTPVGTNSASFTTPALTNSTSYWVKVTNAVNPSGVNSDTATITVVSPVSDFTWASDGSKITITGYTGPGGAVIIPVAIEGLSVTTIGAYAFQNQSTITSVTLPNSLTSIGNFAFESCTGLPSITIPANLTSIGSFAFSVCTKLTEITVDAANANYISLDGVVFNKALTTLIVYPGGKAGPYAVPASVTSIGAGGFSFCTGLTGVNLPASLTNIGDFAFQSCTGLTSVNIPAGVTSIGAMVFVDCSGLTAITVDAANASYSSLDGVLFNKALTVLSVYPSGKAGAYTIPDGVTRINAYAFFRCTGLTSVTIPASVTDIVAYAFYGCTELTRLTIPASVTSIGTSAFRFCTNLSSVTFAGNAPSSFITDVFSDTALGFTVYFYSGAAGFTTPVWQGYSSAMLPLPAGGPVITGAVFAHDFESVTGDTITALAGPAGNKSSNIAVGTLREGTPAGLAFSPAFLGFPDGDGYAAVATQTRLTAPAAHLSFSIHFNDRGDNGNDNDGFQLVRLLSTYRGTGAAASDETIFGIGTDGGGRKLWLTINQHTVLSTANLPFQDGLWHQAGFVFDRGTVTFYLDGVPLGDPVTVPDTSAIPAQQRDWTLMEDPQLGTVRSEYFDGGSYDETALWTRSLLPTEMLALYAQGLAVAGLPPSVPGIVTQPVNQMILNGAFATLTVAAKGIPTPTFQWFLGASGDTSNPVVGAISAAFTTPALNQSTSFWVRVSNSEGSADSQTALVTVVSATNADLAALDPGIGLLSPAFQPSLATYQMAVPHGVDSLTFTPTISSPLGVARIRINGGSFAGINTAASSAPLPLTVGPNLVEIEVTAPDGTTKKTYTVAVTRAAPASVATLPAEVLDRWLVRLRGSAVPSGTVSVFFEYGPTSAYGSATPLQSLTGNTSQDFQAEVGGLPPNAPFHFRAVATGPFGTLHGQDEAFTTAAEPPVVATGSPSAVTNSSATLVGAVDPKGLPTTVRFEYGLTTLYGNSTAPQQVTTAGGIVDFLSPSGGLIPNATYHYRIVAANAAGTSYGEDVTFEVRVGSGVTDPVPTGLPTVTTGGVAGVSTGSVILQGSVNPNQGTTVVQFQYGLSAAYGRVTPVQGVGNGTSSAEVSIPAAGLEPGKTYHYRLVASNSVGTAFGLDATFTTAAEPPVVFTGDSEVVNSTTVRVNGTVRAGSIPAEVFVDYGTDPYVFTLSVQASPSDVAGDTHVPVSAELGELAQGSTYHYRVRAVGEGGLTAVGQTGSFQVALLSGLIQSFPDGVAAEDRAGSLKVDFAPSPTGAGWRFLGEKTWRDPGTSATGLTSGDRLVEFRPVAGYAQPTSETVTVVSGQPQVLLERGYTATWEAGSGSLTVTLRPEAITDETRDFDLLAKWAFYGETASGGQPLWRSSGESVNGLMAGNHLIIAKPVDGRSTPQPVNVRVRSGETTATTITYYIAEEETGTPPAVLEFEVATSNPALPYAYVGQIRSDAGAGSGFVARPGVVATAGHVVFDDGTLASATGVQWLFQHDPGAHQPLPLAPRGYYLLTGYAAQREDDDSPGTSTPDSQNLDAAALYFAVDPGRGGFSGYLASDATSNEFLLSDALKTMAGYPVEGIAAQNLNRMHATPPQPVVFTQSLDRTYTTSEIRGSGGASGGPLCVQHPNGIYYPAAIYLGGTQQMVVRAIDSDVAALIGFAEASSAASAGGTGGNLTGDDLTAVPTPESGSLEVRIEPAAARAEGAGWRIQASAPYLRSGESIDSLAPNTYTIQFASVPGFVDPGPMPVTIAAGLLRTVTFTYEEITVPPGITSPASVAGVRGQALIHQLTASGTQAVFSVQGALPDGLVFDPVQKLISGSPAEAGVFEVMITASNSGGADSQPLVITSFPVLADQSLTAPYLQMLHYPVLSGESGDGLAFEAGLLPLGLELDSETGVLSGIPEESGTFEIELHLSRRGATTSALLTLHLTGTAPVIASTSPLLQTIQYGGSGVMSVEATGLPMPSYQWYQGISGDTSQRIEGATSAVFATPPLTADSNFWVRVSSISGNSDSATFTVSVLPSPNAYLAELTPGSGLLSPPFSPGIFDYTLRVAHVASAVSLTPVPEVASSSVRIQGLVTPSGQPVAVSLEVGENPVSVEVTAADGVTTQNYTLTVDRSPPATASTSATADAGDRSAILAGTVTPNGEATVFFEYGTTESYGLVTPGTDVSGFDPVPVQALVTGLEPDTLHHYRIVVTSPAGVWNGGNLTFTTRPAPPLAATGTPVVDEDSVTTLVGATNPSGRPTTVYFEYGPDTNYGQTTPPATIPAGGNVEDVLFNPPGLTPGMIYHYRLVAENDSGISYGENVTFQVAPTPGGGGTSPAAAPAATILAALDVTSAAALLQANVNPNRGTTFVRFEYGLTPACESTTDSKGVGNGTDIALVVIPVQGLLPGTLYHYRAVASNSLGDTTSSVSTFTTAALQPLAVTGDAVALGLTNARISGTVRARGLETDVFVEYGEDGLTFPVRVRTSPGVVSSSDPVEVSAMLNDLPLARGVFYRLAAERNGSRGVGEPRFFQASSQLGLVQRFTREVPVESRQGSVTVILSPAGTGGWRFVGERTWRPSGASVVGMANGDRIIEFLPVAGLVQPPRETIGVVSGETPIVVERSYYETPAEPDAGLQVLIAPTAIADVSVPVGSRAQWRLSGESTWRNSGDEISALLPGNHLVESRPVPGFTTPPVTSVDVESGKTKVLTLTYASASAPLLNPPAVVSFGTSSSSRDLPYAYVGEFRTDTGTHSGFVVKPRVVATTSEAVFDDATLSIRTGMQWLLQRDRGHYEPRPLVPRGAHVFGGYAARRIEEGTPGLLSITSQNLNVAALYFAEDAGRGGFSGFLASSQDPNEHLESAALKTLIGYPSAGVSSSNQGRMHASPTSSAIFSRVSGQVHSSNVIRGLGGMAGGPLCVRFREGVYYPAAIYLGGGAQSLVRAIDSDVVTMFNRAEISGNGGDNDVGGGITQTSFTTAGTTQDPGAVKVTIQPAAARNAGAGWRLKPDTSYRESGSQKSGLTPRDYILQMRTVSGFQVPTEPTIEVKAGKVSEITFTYVAVNQAPTLTNLTNRSIPEDGTTGAIAFTIGDAESSAGSLTLKRSSSNTTLVPNANIVWGGSGANRTVTVTPAANQSGTSTITVTVDDGELTTSNSFVLTVNAVNDRPTITAISNRSINEDGNTGAISFTVADVDNATTALNVSGTSSNTTLVPNANIVFGGSGANRTVTVTPAANQSGTATITVTVNDGSLNASTAFVLTVNAINDAPTISAIANTSTTNNTPTTALPFTIADVDNSAGSLTLTKSSSNTTLVPEANIVFGGSGANRTVTLTPASGQLGSADITLTVGDGLLSASRTFRVTVTGTPLETWRFTNFGNANDSGEAADLNDKDGDGANNREEYAAGTNPNDPADVFRVLSATRSGAAFRVTVPVKSDRSYTLLRGPSPSGPWSSVTSTGLLGSAGERTLEDPDPVPGSGFYRVAVSAE